MSKQLLLIFLDDMQGKIEKKPSHPVKYEWYRYTHSTQVDLSFASTGELAGQLVQHGVSMLPGLTEVRSTLPPVHLVLWNCHTDSVKSQGCKLCCEMAIYEKKKPVPSNSISEVFLWCSYTTKTQKHKLHYPKTLIQIHVAKTRAYFPWHWYLWQTVFRFHLKTHCGFNQTPN